MAYTQDDPILDDEYNIFVAGNAAFGVGDNDVANVNSIWGSGFGDKGWGQTVPDNGLSQVNPGTTVTATQWQTLFTRVETIDNHEGVGLPEQQPGDATFTVASNALVVGVQYEIVTAGTGDWTTVGAANSSPGTVFTATGTTNGAGDGTANQPSLVTGYLIDAIPSFQSNVTQVYNNRLTAHANVNDLSSSSAGSSNWDVTSVHTITVTFAGGNEARYFFNAGGTIDITASRAGGGAGEDNAAFDQLLPDIGSIRLSANGTNKIGGADSGGSGYIEATTIGYYQLTTSPSPIFRQYASGYAVTNILIEAQTNAAHVDGAGNNGTVITFTVTMSTVTGVSPGVDGTCTVTAQVRDPDTTYIADTWGVVTPSGSAAVQT